MKKIAIASHIALINGKEYDGIGNVMIETMQDIPARFYMVRHSMDGRLPSLVRDYDEAGVVTHTYKLPVISAIGPLRYITEIMATTLFFVFRKKVDIYVGIDPLNALAGVLLKKMGRVEKAVFYTPDYSPKRFGNNLLNRIYHAIDRFCVRQADEVWCVSGRIRKVREDMGLPAAKNIFVPNVPPAKFAQLQSDSHDKYALITMGIIDTQLDNEGVIRAVAQLQDTYPALSFTLVGNGPDEDRLKAVARELGVTDRIHFTGRLPLDETLARVARAGIGLALYTGEWEFNAYGDSTKCREFFFFGVPVISTDTHATVQDIQQYNAGKVVAQRVEAYVDAIKAVLDQYETYAQASYALGQAYVGAHKKEVVRLLGGKL